MAVTCLSDARRHTGVVHLDTIVLECATHSTEVYGSGARPHFAKLTNGETLLVYAGSGSHVDWFANLNADLVEWMHGVGVHRGFSKIATRLLAPIETLPRLLSWDRVTLTGHSLGGAMAMLHGFALKSLYPHLEVTVITFGAPRVGDARWKHAYELMVPNTLRVVLDRDTIPHVPDYHQFDHVGRKLHIDHDGADVPRVKGGWDKLRWWLGWRWDDDRGDHNAHAYAAALKRRRARTNLLETH